MPELNRLYEELERALEELSTSKAQLERALEAEREVARHDALTGVLNHAAIVEELHTRLAGSGTAPLALAMVDVDDLKATNDTYGHQLGDALLKVVAGALLFEDAIVGRYGGDEFIAILPGANRTIAESYRDSTLRRLADAVLNDPPAGTRVPVAASIGLGVYPDEARSVEDLIRLADSGMYAGKRQRPSALHGSNGALDDRSVAKLLSEILPLLTTAGSREEKLNLVSQRLRVGAGYDAVLFEVAGAPTRTSTTWQRATAQAPDELVDAWLQEIEQSQDHPLGLFVEQARRPVFLDVQEDKRLTDNERALLAAAGFRSALVVPMVWQDRMVGMLSAGSKETNAFTSWDAQFLSAVSSQVTAIVFMTSLVEELQLASVDLARARAETVMMLAAAAEAHDPTTGHHLKSVRSIVEILALELGYNQGYAEELALASVMHDLGKIRVPDSVLSSSGALGKAEWELMKHHTTWGGEFLAGRPGFELMATIARHHHERWDGSGYPDGLAAEAIPEAAVVVSVADAFDAMTSDRPYRKRRPTSHAVREIVAHSGTQFSPRVVDALVRLHKRHALRRPRVHAAQQRAA